jgi:hypothetical protein
VGRSVAKGTDTRHTPYTPGFQTYGTPGTCGSMFHSSGFPSADFISSRTGLVLVGLVEPSCFCAFFLFFLYFSSSLGSLDDSNYSLFIPYPEHSGKQKHLSLTFSASLNFPFLNTILQHQQSSRFLLRDPGKRSGFALC